MRGGKPIHMVDLTAHPNIQSPLLDAVLAMPTQVSNLLGQGPIPIGMQRSIPMTGRLEIGGNAATPIPTWPRPVSTHLGTHFKQPVDYAHTKFRYPNVNEAE